jgi:multiple sugar transport system substrate-binding protein
MRPNRLLLLVVVMLMPFSLALAQDEPVTITFWHTYNEVSAENEMLTETLIPMFEEEHPNIQVESVPYPYDGFRQALLTAAAGGEGPDLVRLDIIWSPEFAEQGILAELDTVMPDFQEYADRVFPGSLSTNAYNGHYYGLPLDTNTRTFNYSPAFYEAAGIEAPPATIDELRAQCEAAQALGEGNYLFTDSGTPAGTSCPGSGASAATSPIPKLQRRQVT